MSSILLPSLPSSHSFIWEPINRHMCTIKFTQRCTVTRSDAIIINKPHRLQYPNEVRERRYRNPSNPHMGVSMTRRSMETNLSLSLSALSHVTHSLISSLHVEYTNGEVLRRERGKGQSIDRRTVALMRTHGKIEREKECPPFPGGGERRRWEYRTHRRTLNDLPNVVCGWDLSILSLSDVIPFPFPLHSMWNRYDVSSHASHHSLLTQFAPLFYLILPSFYRIAWSVP